MSRAGSHEREIKLRVADVTEARRRLASAGFAVTRERIFESNTVLDTPGASLRAAGSLLRVRVAGSSAVVTWKGPGQADRHKVREEVEFQADDADAARLMFERLGYRPMFVYEKYRTEYADGQDTGTATLDETPIGVFMELEGDAQWIDEAAGRLGYGVSDYVVHSYSELYRLWCSQLGLPVTDMTFSLEC